MTKLETWIAIGSLVMGIMFVVLMLSFYSFLIGPKGKGPEIYTDVGGVLIQIISISGIPSVILTGIVFGITKSSRAMYAGVIVSVTGVILIVGMTIVIREIPKITIQYLTAGIDSLPYIFVIAGTAVTCLGCYIIIKPNRPKHRVKGEFIE